VDCAFTVAFNPQFDPLLEASREATNTGIRVWLLLIMCVISFADFFPLSEGSSRSGLSFDHLFFFSICHSCPYQGQFVFN